MITEREKMSPEQILNDVQPPSTAKHEEYKMEIKWKNVIFMTYLHIAAVYGFLLPKSMAAYIIFWTFTVAAGFGTTAGAHRYFTHKTYKANKKLKILLLVLHTIAGQVGKV